MRETHGGPIELGQPVAWPAIVALMCVLSVFALSSGFSYPALALNLEARGYSAGEIGLPASASGVGHVVIGLMAPLLAVRFGMWRLVLAALLVTGCSVIAYGFIAPLWPWIPLRFLHGGASALLFIISESLLIELSPVHLRGRLVGTYAALNSLFFAIGPALIPLIGFVGPSPYVMVGAILLLLGLPAVLLRGAGRPPEPVAIAEIARTMSVIPLLLAAVWVFGFFDGVFLSLWGPYAIARGITADEAAVLLAVAGIGNVALQPLLGWLADRWPKRLLFLGCIAGTLAGAVALPWLDLREPWLTWPVLAAWGTFAFGIYTVSLTIVGGVLSGTRLVAANAGFGVMWGAGALVGPGLVGWFMDLTDYNGFVLALAGLFVLLLLVCLAFPLVAGNRSQHPS